MGPVKTTQDRREDRARMDLARVKRYLPLFLLVFLALYIVVDLLPGIRLRRAAEAADRFSQVDRAVIAVEGGAVRTITDAGELAAYKEVLEPGAILSGDHNSIRDAVIRKEAEVTFYIGQEALIREGLYLLDETAGAEWGRPTEIGPLIGMVDGCFRSLDQE